MSYDERPPPRQPREPPERPLIDSKSATELMTVVIIAGAIFLFKDDIMKLIGELENSIGSAGDILKPITEGSTPSLTPSSSSESDQSEEEDKSKSGRGDRRQGGHRRNKKQSNYTIANVNYW